MYICMYICMYVCITQKIRCIIKLLECSATSEPFWSNSKNISFFEDSLVLLNI